MLERPLSVFKASFRAGIIDCELLPVALVQRFIR
jgi:hypothetical protein